MVISFAILAFPSCSKNEHDSENSTWEHLIQWGEIPTEYPVMAYPELNQPDSLKILLGKKLFFDARLSNDNQVSCASCHIAKKAYSDTVMFSLGSDNSMANRNSPPLLNIGFHPYFNREGGVPSLEMQALVPIQEHNELNTNIVLIKEELSEDLEYQEISQNAFGIALDEYVITRSLAQFERTLVSFNSRFDDFLKFGLSVYTTDEYQGLKLFYSEKTKCYTCHGGMNFSDYSFQNNGLYEEYEDPGRFRLTRSEEDRAVFKVPSLRNVSLTGPYMHDGSMSSLRQVVLHYNSGGKNHPNKNNNVRPMGLTGAEIDQLVAFLNTLTEKQ